MFTPPTQLSRIDDAEQYGLGRYAEVMGALYDVYRRTPTLSGSLISPAGLLFSAFSCEMRRTTKRDAIENNMLDTLTFIGECDDRDLQLGDVFVAVDAGEETGTAYVYAQRRRTRDHIFVRVEQGCAILRPRQLAGNADEMPASGVLVRKGRGKYGGAPIANRETLVLENGFYHFATVAEMQANVPGTSAQPAWASVPCGLQPRARVKDGHKPSLPTTLTKTQFTVYIPPTPGAFIVEQVIVKPQSGDQYVIDQVYESDPAGLVGTVALVTKIAL